MLDTETENQSFETQVLRWKILLVTAYKMPEQLPRFTKNYTTVLDGLHPIPHRQRTTTSRLITRCALCFTSATYSLPFGGESVSKSPLKTVDSLLVTGESGNVAPIVCPSAPKPCGSGYGRTAHLQSGCRYFMSYCCNACCVSQGEQHDDDCADNYVEDDLTPLLSASAPRLLKNTLRNACLL